ncbi:MAG: 4-(cytidine 5'-diphospho)-2-C-methyl-D-erythritol kinase [Candidatus Omnitrophica bacterium]|nr:4-(cytidine 5'-diphospho)-2-C-methyl-D-erythritol kinase [Candidatus Omnitrophota bacterium]
MRSLSIKAPAKLNLLLRVLSRRRDGYHNIQSLFERINLFDNIRVTPRDDSKITVSCTHPKVPGGAGNLAYKAAKLLKCRFSIRDGVNIAILKNIPVAAGLGGGSSDAAAVILALNQLWKLKLGKIELSGIAACIGSDVGFFLRNSSFSLVTGRGQLLRQLKTDLRLWHILVVPDVFLSTKKVYRQFDRLKSEESKGRKAPNKSPTRTLTKETKNVTMLSPLDKLNRDKGVSLARLISRLARSSNLSIHLQANHNSLEQAAVFFAPQISKIKRMLRSFGVKYVGMSGSGPSVFGILHSRKEAEDLKKKLAKFRDWRTFVVRTF